MFKLQIAALLAVIVLLIAMMPSTGRSEAEMAHQRYCRMVQVWKEDARSGVPENRRAGWPPFKGECRE